MFKQVIAALFALCAAASMAAVDVNKADQAALESVKGIGPGLSGKLLDERKKGPYKDWNDLIDRVGGVGPGNAAKFSTAGLTVNNAPYSAPAAAPKEAKAASKATPAAATPAK
jgi:competence protein ComEA